MLRMIEIELFQIRRYVTIAFQDDQELIDKFHKINGDLVKCVDSTVGFIQFHSKHYVLRYYAVFFNSIPIGFTVISIVSRLLYSFGLNINYRTKQNVSTWFNMTKQLLPNGMTCILWSKNSRAINFLIRNGLKISSKENELTVLKTA